METIFMNTENEKTNKPHQRVTKIKLKKFR